MADKLLFMLTSQQQNPIQEVPGPLFGRSHANANTWMQLLHPAVNRAWAHQDLRPARTAAAFATLLATTQTQDGPPPPLLGMMVRSDRSLARLTPRNSRTTTVARRSATRSKTCA
jgi:hypothetical protein